MTALRMVENEKGVSLETLVDAIEEALLKAYHNLPGAISQARIEIDKKTGRVTVMAMDEDEDGNPIGEFDDTPKNFGRIAQSTARSVIMQRLRDADDQRVFGDFAGREGQIITGTVQAPCPGRPTMVQVSDDFEAVLPDGEKFPVRPTVTATGSAPTSWASSAPNAGRASPCRAPTPTSPSPVSSSARSRRSSRDSSRSRQSPAKPATARRSPWQPPARASMPRVLASDPWGRVCAPSWPSWVVRRSDIVDYSDDPARFVANSLSPARVTRVVVHSVDNRTATAIVPDFQLSLAIGKEGQNARLAARLTNYHIDIHADTETGDDEIASRVSTPDDVTSRS